MTEYLLISASGKQLIRGTKADMDKWSKQFPGSTVERSD